MKLSIGFSSCPNDTYMFNALVHGLVDCEDLSFEVHMADIEQLNNMAIERHLDISKISIGAYPDISSSYILMDSGSALGYKNGPILVSKQRIYPDEISHLNIAVPGVKTTANLLLSILHPGVKKKKTYLFSDIEDAVISNEVDAGLLIHEGRFTYQKKGLKLITDLGEVWEEKKNKPIPLGSIAVRRDFNPALQKQINRVIRRSVEFAFANKREGYSYIKQHAKELDDEVIYRHIDLYVNDFSLALGEEGRSAIQYLLENGHRLGILNKVDKEIFIKYQEKL